jgi:hypothetical protein
MLLRFWQIVIEFLIRIFDRYRSAHAGSRYGSDRFDGRYLEINSPLITGPQERGLSNSPETVLLPKELKTGDRTCFSKEERKSRPEFRSVIEVSYVEGEFLSKSLDARNNSSKRAKASFWFATALAVVLAFAGFKSNFQTYALNNSRENRVISDNRSFENSNVGVESRREKALSEIERPAEVATIARAKPVLRKNEDLSKKNMPSQTLDQTISPSTDTAPRSAVKVDAVVGSKPVDNYEASVDDTTNMPRQADQLDRSNPKSHKSNSANQEGVSFVPKNIASSRNQKDRTHPIRTARSSSSGVPETVVNGVLGGLAGAVVGGPVGLIAGATVGATAGKAIAHSWGLR